MKIQLILLALFLSIMPVAITANDTVDRLLPQTTLTNTAVITAREELPGNQQVIVNSEAVIHEILFSAWPNENDKPTTHTLSIQTADLLGRTTRGIWRWKTSSGTVPWWSCGIGLKDDEAKRKAVEIVLAATMGIEKAKTDYGIKINIWGLLGTMSRESGFDECAIGMHTRFWAYKEGYLKRPKRHISHSLDEIFELVDSEKWKKKWGWVDGGLGQLLWGKIYKGPLEDLLSINPGALIVANEMAKRLSGHLRLLGLIKKTGKKSNLWQKNSWVLNRPWAFWPGSLSQDYDEKVTKRAKILGAKDDEI